MHCNLLNPHHLTLHPPFLIHLLRFQLLQRRKSTISKHPAKHRIFPIQMGRRSIRNEELATICIRPLICHRHYPAHIMSQRRTNFVFKFCAPDRGAYFWGSGCGGAGLDHESWKGAVKGGRIVKTGGAEGEKVLRGRELVTCVRCLGDIYDRSLCRRCGGMAYFRGFGNGFTEDLDFDVTGSGVQCHRHG